MSSDELPSSDESLLLGMLAPASPVPVAAVPAEGFDAVPDWSDGVVEGGTELGALEVGDDVDVGGVVGCVVVVGCVDVGVVVATTVALIELAGKAGAVMGNPALPVLRASWLSRFCCCACRSAWPSSWSTDGRVCWAWANAVRAAL